MISSRRAWGLGLLVIASISLPLVGITGAYSYAQNAADDVSDLGWWTLPLFCLVAGLAVGFALVPSHLTSLLAGLFYGLAGGGIAALIVVGLGASIGYWFSRALAQDTVRSFVDRFNWTRVLAAELLDSSGPKATLAMTLTRLPPQVPFALGNILAASCRVPWRVFLTGTLLGMAPRVLLVTSVGASLSTWEPGASIPGALWWAASAAVIGFGGLAIWSGILLRRYSSGNEPITAT